jgi:hypothetical protein
MTTRKYTQYTKEFKLEAIRFASSLSIHAEGDPPQTGWKPILLSFPLPNGLNLVPFGTVGFDDLFPF